jgi:hypothetical protein
LGEENQMTPVLLCTRAGYGGQTVTAPLRMKTAEPGWLSYVGFPAKGLGLYYLERRGHEIAHFDFIEMQPFYTSTTIEERQGVEKVLYFRDEKTVDHFVDAPDAFPYERHDVFIVQVLPPPADLLPPQPAAGLFTRFAKLFK